MQLPEFGVAFPKIPGTTRDHIATFARKVEKLGFDSAWVFDRLVYDNFGSLALLGALAVLTERVNLGTSVLLPFLHNPLVLAKELATIDRASGGRLTLGLGIGSRGVDFDAAGLPRRDRGRRMEETLMLMRQAWSGEPIDHSGAVFDVHVPAVGPRPAQSPLPVWLSGRSSGAIARAVRLADGFVIGRGSPDYQRTWLADLQRAAVTEQRDLQTLPVAALTFLGPSAEAIATHFARYYGDETWRVDPVHDGIYGPPDQAAEQLRQYAELGLNTIIAVPTVLDLDELDRLAEAVDKLRQAG